jgi:hypothetical protein
MVKAHHWSIDRHARKMKVLDFISKNPGIEERIILKVLTKTLKSSPNLIRTYLEELEIEEEIQKIDTQFYSANYESPKEETEMTS